MKNIVIEGARGTGKSSVSQYIRSQTTNSTLINFTGFNEKGLDGLYKVTDYYTNWFLFFRDSKEEDFLFIHDRFFFSEMVYSKLYKDYDFSEAYRDFLIKLDRSFRDISLIVLQAGDITLRENLKRDKSLLFGKEPEDVKESIRQQDLYLELAEDLNNFGESLEVHVIDVDGKSVKEIGDEILALTLT